MTHLGSRLLLAGIFFPVFYKNLELMQIFRLSKVENGDSAGRFARNSWVGVGMLPKRFHRGMWVSFYDRFTDKYQIGWVVGLPGDWINEKGGKMAVSVPQGMVFLDSVKNENGDAKEGSRQRLLVSQSSVWGKVLFTVGGGSTAPPSESSLLFEQFK